MGTRDVRPATMPATSVRRGSLTVLNPGRATNDNNLPVGTLKCREYEVSLNGASGSLALTLGRPDADTMPGKYARYVRAHAYGMISIFGLPGHPVAPLSESCPGPNWVSL